MESETFDGTQPLAPCRVYPDPLAGLVTGESSEGALMTTWYDDVMVPVAKPVEADPEAVRAMTEAALSDFVPEQAEARSGSSSTGPLPRQREPERSALGYPGMLPVMPGQHAGKRVRQALRHYPQPRQRREAAEAARLVPKAPKGNMGGVIVALILIVIFGVVAFEVFAGIVSAIMGSLD
ncbi:MAG: hypothetical protein GEU86_10705 [Actinophytocola sp.]|nr:hypothetical protein [Actinophytocola sp.]